MTGTITLYINGFPREMEHYYSKKERNATIFLWKGIYNGERLEITITPSQVAYQALCNLSLKQKELIKRSEYETK